MARRWWLVPILLLGGWIAMDVTVPQHSSLTNFDGHEVGRLETEMWRSYYEHRRVALFAELVRLLRDQYHVPFWQACRGAYDAARAAVVFQRGHNRAEYAQALPDIIRFYTIIRRDSDIEFPVREAAQLELEWWIIHRERAAHPPGDLERSLAALQAAIYGKPASFLAEHAKARADAMLIRDTRAEAGGVSEQDWRRIGDLLDTSWVSLQAAVAH
jgi:hypothetical protein